MVLLFPPDYTTSQSTVCDPRLDSTFTWISGNAEMITHTANFLNGSLPQPSLHLDEVRAQRRRNRQPEEDLIYTPDILSNTLPTIHVRDGLLYVAQDEWACTYPGDPGNTKIIASSDATTCHVVIVRDPVTGAVALCHISDFRSIGGPILQKMVEKVIGLSWWIQRDRSRGNENLHEYYASSSGASNGNQATAQPQMQQPTQSTGHSNGSNGHGHTQQPSTTNGAQGGAFAAGAMGAYGLAGNGTLPQQQQVVTSSTGTPPAPAIDMTTPLELYIVGGFEDKRGISERLSFQILNFFATHQLPFRIQLCCVGKINTTGVVSQDFPGDGTVPSPLAYGAAMDIFTGRIFRAKYRIKGPDESIRHVKILYADRELTCDDREIYNYINGMVEIKAFQLRDDARRHLEYQLSIGKLKYLRENSTSPGVEPPDFFDNSRAAVTLALNTLRNPHDDDGLYIRKRQWKRQPCGNWGLF